IGYSNDSLAGSAPARRGDWSDQSVARHRWPNRCRRHHASDYVDRRGMGARASGSMALASPPLALKQVSARIFGAMITVAVWAFRVYGSGAGWRDGAVQLFKCCPLASAVTPLIAVSLW